MKTLLLLSTSYTGHGHKSIEISITEQFEAYKESVRVIPIDVFELGGFRTKALGKSYRFFTRYMPFLYRLYYQICEHFPHAMNRFNRPLIEKQILALVNQHSPAVIVTVHPGCVGMILDILEKNKLAIPFITIVPDIISFSRLCIDKRSDTTICLTKEVLQSCEQQGLDKSRLYYSGYCVRKQFLPEAIEEDVGAAAALDSTDAATFGSTDSATFGSTDAATFGSTDAATFGSTDAATFGSTDSATFGLPKKLHILLVNNTESTKKISSMITILLQNFDCKITVITGKDKKMLTKLRTNYKAVPESILTFRGYVNDMGDYLRTCDLLLTRGGPNMIMEAVSCCIPMIIFGALPGQESRNPELVVSNQLGIYCPQITQLPHAIHSLLENNGALYHSIKMSQKEYRQPEAAGNIVTYLINKVMHS